MSAILPTKLTTATIAAAIASTLAHAQTTPTSSDASEPHWSLQEVTQPSPPTTAPAGYSLIDAFVTERLAAAGLKRSRPADRATLIRRLYLTMLGLPPSPKEVATFVADRRAKAFEHLVDRVLQDDRYGEHWARHWLDVVRFAETDGFETNHIRPNAWRYRDYVIDAFNSDMPYDQFVREQLAGDALGADIATGFLVAGQRDIVSSPDPALTAQQRADQLDDMVATTGAAFLGMTVGCARCHSHKFDPITQRDYYALTAIFQGVHHGERGLPMPAQQAAELARINEEIASLDAKLAPFLVRPPEQRNDDTNLRSAVTYTRNEEQTPKIRAKYVRMTIFATSQAEPCIDEFEIWAGDQNVGLASNGARATASSALPGYAIHKVAHANDGLVGNSHSWISNEAGGGWLQIELARPEVIERITWGRDRDGVVKDRLAVSYRIEAALNPNEWQVIASSSDRTPFGTAPKARAPVSHRFDARHATARDQGTSWLAQRTKLTKQRSQLSQPPKAYAGTFKQPGPTHLLRRGEALNRGEQVSAGTLSLWRPSSWQDETPEQQRRLHLARWITDPRHPLTARVLVNRIWQQHFGAGLVTTPSDFGRNGAAPSHPRLLDWLAHQLVTNQWSIKSIQRLILTSATWQQANTPRADALRIDAGNRLLWRFAPRRLAAEAIRDCILAASGELDRRSGGPSFLLHDVGSEYVRHYQPKETFGPNGMRRMVYALKVRTEPDLVFTAFDCPDGSLAMPKRGLSTTPLQSLNLWNSEFLQQRASKMARRLTNEAGDNPTSAIARAWQLAFQRDPTENEAATAGELVRSAGLAALCRALLNANEFLFLP